MLRTPAFGDVARATPAAAKSMACLGFVAILGLAFWAGALWIGNLLLQVLAG